MNQKQQKNSKIVWGIIGVIIFLAIGAFIVYKMVQANKDKKISSNQTTESNDKPSHTSPPQTDSPTPSQEEELEKYLLEKRLDLKKYFVFNLGKEVKTSQQAETKGENVRSISTSLSSDLTKLTASYEKKAEAKGYGIIIGKIEEIDEKIKNGQNCYVVFEKDDEFEDVYFARGTVDEKGAITCGKVNLLTNVPRQGGLESLSKIPIGLLGLNAKQAVEKFLLDYDKLYAQNPDYNQQAEQLRKQVEQLERELEN
ncbi:17041_t:CDS:2 [Entrophospora sp. SA101]|nr:17041_t:CDS:2 [Entrophospora sp. SA101]